MLLAFVVASAFAAGVPAADLTPAPAAVVAHEDTRVALAPTGTMAVPQGLPAADPNVNDPDFVARYYPFSLNANAAKPVADNFMLIQVFGFCLPLGALWGPLVLYPSPKPEINGDIIVSWLVPTVTAYGWVVGWSVVGSVLSAFTAGVGGIVGCLGCLGLPLVYVANVATMNAWDRAYKGIKSGPPASSGPAYTPPPASSTPAPSSPAAPAAPAAPPPPSYSY